MEIGAAQIVVVMAVSAVMVVSMSAGIVVIRRMEVSLSVRPKSY